MRKHDMYRTYRQQVEAELVWLIDLLRREGVASYLEVGSKFGGSLWRIANSLPQGSRVVSVDLPWGDKSTQPHLEECVAELRRTGYDAHLLLGDSTHPDIVAGVRELGPFDACLIDANHTLPYVRQDWQNYGSLCRIVAFHDIAWRDRPERKSTKYPIQVPQFWEEVRQDHPYQEIKVEPRDNGIGVLWRS
jgi:predicted O-methyltransferase YrrM